MQRLIVVAGINSLELMSESYKKRDFPVARGVKKPKKSKKPNRFSSKSIYFEGSDDERTELSKYIYDCCQKLKYEETLASKFAKNAVGCRIVNKNTIEEQVSWAILKTLEKWSQHKMIKEYEYLSSVPRINVFETYHEKFAREKRIKEIAHYFEISVDMNSSLISFTELPQIWGYFKTVLNSKMNNLYSDGKNKQPTEGLDLSPLEQCLEVNEDNSDIFQIENSSSIEASDIISVLRTNIEKIDPPRKEFYVKFFDAIYIHGYTTSEACDIIQIDKKFGIMIHDRIKDAIHYMKEEVA